MSGKRRVCGWCVDDKSDDEGSRKEGYVSRKRRICEWEEKGVWLVCR